MRNWKFLIVSLVVMAGVAYSARQGIGSVSKVNDPKPQHFVSGFFTGSEAKDPLSDTKNKQAYHLCATKVYDFPALGGVNGPLDNICHKAISSLTITGCGFNDRLSNPGVDQALVNEFGFVTAHLSAANTVEIVACAPGITDAGSFNMPDASYTVCCDGY